jgi:type VI secretion system protein ImpH
MATDARQQTLDLKQKLLKSGEKFSFFQALRLLRLIAAAENVSEDDYVTVRPRLGLGFPTADIDTIESVASGGCQVTANFLGLYGVDSPLPTFYTEDLLVEQADGHAVNREFLDILAQSVYPLFFQAWLKSKPALRVLEYQDQRMLRILYSFVGLEIDDGQLNRPAVGSLLFCGSVYNQQTRTAAGLKTILSACFPAATVQVKELQPVWDMIPETQQCRLGMMANTLGEDAHLGDHCRSLDGLVIAMHDLSSDLYFSLMPGGAEHQRFSFLVDYYLIEALPLRVELTLREGQVAPTTLSKPFWSRLGMDSWLVHPTDTTGSSMWFDLQLRSGYGHV